VNPPVLVGAVETPRILGWDAAGVVEGLQVIATASRPNSIQWSLDRGAHLKRRPVSARA
jgi:hypothetical protein